MFSLEEQNHGGCDIFWMPMDCFNLMTHCRNWEAMSCGFSLDQTMRHSRWLEHLNGESNTYLDAGRCPTLSANKASPSIPGWTETMLLRPGLLKNGNFPRWWATVVCYYYSTSSTTLVVILETNLSTVILLPAAVFVPSSAVSSFVLIPCSIELAPTKSLSSIRL